MKDKKWEKRVIGGDMIPLKKFGKRESCFVLLMAFGIEGITSHSSSSTTTQCPQTIPALFQPTLFYFLLANYQNQAIVISNDIYRAWKKNIHRNKFIY